jgi:hypothetical protein
VDSTAILSKVEAKTGKVSFARRKASPELSEGLWIVAAIDEKNTNLSKSYLHFPFSNSVLVNCGYFSFNVKVEVEQLVFVGNIILAMSN